MSITRYANHYDGFTRFSTFTVWLWSFNPVRFAAIAFMRTLPERVANWWFVHTPLGEGLRCAFLDQGDYQKAYEIRCYIDGYLGIDA